MAMLPSIMSLFHSAPAAPRQEPTLQQQVQQTAAGNPTAPGVNQPGAANPGGGGPAAFPATQTGEGSPLAKYADLWSLDPKSPPVQGQLLPKLTLDPTKLGQAAASINFASQVPAELLQTAMSGGAGAGEAMLQVLNKVGQFGFANALAASGELVERSFGAAQTQLESQFLPGAIRRTQITQSMLDNPAFQDPAMAPMLQSLQGQLAQKYPTAQPQEIAQMAQEYLAGAAQMIVKGAGGQVVDKQQLNQRNAFAAPEQDWSKYLEG